MNPNLAENQVALSICCQNGLCDIARKLLEIGVYPNNVKYENKTPLIWTCENGHSEIANLLIAFKADINLSNNNYTPLCAAIINVFL